jgi:hypothetical protein
MIMLQVAIIIKFKHNHHLAISVGISHVNRREMWLKRKHEANKNFLCCVFSNILIFSSSINETKCYGRFSCVSSIFLSRACSTIYKSMVCLKKVYFSLFLTSSINISPSSLLLTTESQGSRNEWNK